MAFLQNQQAPGPPSCNTNNANNACTPSPPSPGGDSGGTITGYSIQMLEEHLAPALGIDSVEVEMLADNNAIMSATGLLRPRCGRRDTLCIGGAAISITQERETRFDFLASYFTNNVRLLAPVSAEPVEMLLMIFSAAWQLLLGLVVFAACFWAVMTPVVWTLEMLCPGKDAIPIFQPPADAKHVVLPSLKTAALWTASTLQGAHLARPNSWIVKHVITPLLRLGKSLLGIIATAAMAAIFTIDATQASALAGLAALTPRHVVCYNSASDFNTALVAQHASERGFQTLAFDSLASTYDGFFRSQCDAVIYDETLLSGELINRRRVTASTDPTYARVQMAGIVGESLKWDPYGFVMTSNHSLYESVNRVLIGIATDSRVRGRLESMYLHTAPAAQTGFGITYFSRWFWIPAAAAAALLVFAFVVVHGANVGRVRDAERKSVCQAKGREVRKANRKAKMAKGYSALALQPADALVHDMVGATFFALSSRPLPLALLSSSLRCSPIFPSILFVHVTSHPVRRALRAPGV